MRALMRALKPTSFDDVAALVALYRPGPMAANMHNDYADRKNGRKPIEYLHPDLEEVLGDTYGLMIYQESVMRVAQKIAGYSLAEADNLRKAMGKKVREIVAKERDKFISGSVTNGYGEVLGKQLFDIIEPFADYAFNKSHAFGYGLVAYQTAYLKAHSPGRVLRLPADERQGDVGEGGRLHRRVSGDGHPGAQPRHQPLGHRLRRARPERGARRRRRCRSGARARSRSGSRRCATSAPASSPSCSRSATPTARSPASTTSPSGCPSRCSTSAPSSR